MNQQNSNNDRRVRLKDFADRAGMSKRTVWRRIAAKAYPEPIRDGGLCFYHESTVQRLLKGPSNG